MSRRAYNQIDGPINRGWGGGEGGGAGTYKQEGLLGLIGS